MLVIKVELWPYGQESNAKTLGVVEVINDGTGTNKTGNYDIHFYAEGYHEKNRPEKAFKIAKIKAFDRLDNSFWVLVGKAFNFLKER